VSIASSVCHGEGSKREEEKPRAKVSQSPEPQRFFGGFEKTLEFGGKKHAGSHTAAAPYTHRGSERGMPKSSLPFIHLC